MSRCSMPGAGGWLLGPRAGGRARDAPQQDRGLRPGRAESARALRLAQNFGGVLSQLPRFPKKPWEIMKIHDFSLIFHENS